MSSQECKTKPQVVSVNGDKPVFFPFSIETSKCSVSWNNIIYQYANICIPNVVKHLNAKAFNLMSRTNKLNGMKRVNVSANLGLMFVIIDNVEIKINADVNAKN